jgi:integral membrane protein
MRPLEHFRWVALAEGVSYVVLVFVAMPLKYLAGMPAPVRVVGGLHGALFVLFVAALLRAAWDRRWSLVRCAVAFGASLVPFGTFIFDRSLRRELTEGAAVGAGLRR